MNFLNSLLFGFIQGLTEFFPVSSSAHLNILGNLFGLDAEDPTFIIFGVFVHFGSLLAILIYYLQDIGNILVQINNIKSGRRGNYSSLRLFLMVFISSAPLLLLLIFYKSVDLLGSNSIFIGFMLLINGLILFVSDHFDNLNKDEKNITISDALIIGICQLVGAIPGISRVGVTACAAMATGSKREFSIKYANILSILPIFGVNIIHMVNAAATGFYWNLVPVYLVGMAVSFASSLFSIRVITSISKNSNFSTFAYYCWVAGVLFIILTMIF